MLEAFKYIFIFSSFALCLKYNYGAVDWVIVLINSILLHFFLKNERINTCFFVLFLLVYIFCSCQVVALLELKSYGFYKNYIEIDEYRSLSIWSSHLYLVILFAVNIFKKFFKTNHGHSLYNNVQISYRKSNDKLYIWFYLFILCLQVISISFGLAENQFAATLVLPFHLNGIIDELRGNVAAFVISIYLFDKYEKNEKLDKRIIVIFILYAFMEVLVRNSKGAFVYSFLPIIALMGFMGKINTKTVLKVLLPLIAAMAILYPIVESARGDGQLSLQNLIKHSKSINKVDETEKSSPYIRTFLTGVYYTKIYNNVSSDETSFDFRNVPFLVVFGGGAGYMTRVIDGAPEGYHYSAGITGLNDALIWGGYPLCYIVAVLLALLALYGDKGKLMQKVPLYKVILFFFFYKRLTNTTITFFVDAALFSELGQLVMKYILTRYYYKKLR